MKITNQLSMNLSSIVLYRNVSNSPVMHAFYEFVRADGMEEKIIKYSDFAAALYENGGDLGLYLEDALRADDNVYVRMAAAGKEIPDYMQKEFLRELEIFTSLTYVEPEALLAAAELPSNLAGFANTKMTFEQEIPELLKTASKRGYGIYARFGMFRVSPEGKIVPVPCPDPVTVDDLIGYELERGQLIANTKALLDGKPAANALLTGDAGTGKSSSVKAVTNMFRSEGLRLIELKKEQLLLLSNVMGEIRDNPLKFIIFIDDLSFSADDGSFGSLKAVLEGSASAKADNAVIYATSNRRHMIRETFSSREGDEVHRNDTVEEQTSLAARFGLNILFQKPDKKLYLTIVHALAERKHIALSGEQLDIRAEAFALCKGRRSARVAEQFTDSLVSEGL